MANITKNFPGVYATITDQSFITPPTSPFKPGLVGVASKGPFDTPTKVRSLKEFVAAFGKPLTTTYTDGIPDNNGYFLADAVAMISDFTDGATVVRVGNQYQEITGGAVSSATGTYIYTNAAASAYVNALMGAGNTVYLAVSEAGKDSSVNLTAVSAANSGTITVDAALGATYTSAASLVYSTADEAAWNAEGVLNCLSYSAGTVAGTGTVTGTKNAFQIAVSGTTTGLKIGSVYKIVDPSSLISKETHEVRVTMLSGTNAYFATTNDSQIGYQALPLQDTYTNGRIYEATGTSSFLWLQAATAGEWANGTSSKTGIYVQCSPGSAPGTKKLSVYWNSTLVETFDNLSSKKKQPDNTTDNPDWYVTRINGVSQYITITNPDVGEGHVANTVAPWNSAYYVTSGTTSMPYGAVNAGDLALSSSGTVTTLESGGQLTNGFNGANPSAADFVGSYDEVNDVATGLKSFEDADNSTVNVICAPRHYNPTSTTSGVVSVLQELRRIARKINAEAVAEVPAGLSLKEAVDWHNAQGVYANTMGYIDDSALSLYWNWFQIASVFDGSIKWVPPSLGALYAMAVTFARGEKYKAAAGETRGVIIPALKLAYERTSDDVRQSSYRNGNSINSILKMQNRFVLYGDRTMQRAESKMSATHNVMLVNDIVANLSIIGRRYVFEPNDPELLDNIRQAFVGYLDGVKNARGIEAYELTIDTTNNNATTRNLREVIVDLAVIPTDAMERMFINTTVRESGAVLNSVA